MKNRSASKILFAQQVDRDGFLVRQPLPTLKIEQVDPFILLLHVDAKAPQQ